MQNRFDTQLLIEGHDLDEDAIHDGILHCAAGDCLLVVGDEDLIKVHYHTDTPWKVLEYAAVESAGIRRHLRRHPHHHHRKYGASGQRPARVTP